MIARALRIPFAIWVVGVAPSAFADDGSESALAEAMFREGRALLEAGETGPACQKLEGSYRLDRRVGTLLNLAACREMEGRVATAWANFLDAARIAKTRGNQAARELEDTARQRAALLEPRLFRITLEVAEPAPDLVLALDGRELPSAARETPLPLDPGPHTLTATRPGHAPLETRIDVPNGPGARVVKISALSKLQTHPTEQGVVAPPPLKSPPAEGPVRSLVWVGGAATVLAAGAGTFFGLRAISRRDARDDACPSGRCGPEGLERQEEAFAASTAANVSFVIAAAAATFTVVALVWPRQKAAARPSALPLLRF